MRILVPAFFVTLVAAVIIGNVWFLKATVDTIEVTIEDKERIVETDSDGKISSRYLVFTDKEVFQNVDSMLFWKMNSSDVQSKMKIGQRCKLTVNGWRVPWMSSYRNILEANCK